MVRFKVIKGSQLLIAIAAIVLALVVGFIVLSSLLSSDAPGVQTNANIVQAAPQSTAEAETNPVFASVSVERVNAERPSVLIYHTHTHEAYRQVTEDEYVAVEAWRTLDESHSVVRVGDELASQLKARGFEVVHDTTDHEQNDMMTAYTRSLKTLEGYERTFDLYIDLHRDAYIEGVDPKPIVNGDPQPARLMLLVGNGEGFTVKPHYAENLAFARALTEEINRVSPGLCKDVLVKDGRYNQNIGVFSILVEVGHNQNTLAEALDSVPALAEAIDALLIEKTNPAIEKLQKEWRAQSE